MAKAKITRPKVAAGAVSSASGVQTRSMLRGSMPPPTQSGMITRSMAANIKASAASLKKGVDKRMKIYPGGSATFDESLGRKKK